MVSIKSFRDLDAWRSAMDVVELVYRVTRSLPQHEVYGLSSQMQRAAVSIPSNIAEGHARSSTREFLHYVSIALGSMAELDTQIEIANRLGYVGGDQLSQVAAKLGECGRLVRGLQKALNQKS